jgi:hypothetical protein
MIRRCEANDLKNRARAQGNGHRQDAREYRHFADTALDESALLDRSIAH